MNLWRRFIRWLARKELEALGQDVFRLGVDHGFVLEMAKRTAYAEGQLAGRQEMLDYISGIVGCRMEGAQDYVTPEDLAMAKKGLIH